MLDMRFILKLYIILLCVLINTFNETLHARQTTISLFVQTHLRSNCRKCQMTVIIIPTELHDVQNFIFIK